MLSPSPPAAPALIDPTLESVEDAVRDCAVVRADTLTLVDGLVTSTESNNDGTEHCLRRMLCGVEPKCSPQDLLCLFQLPLFRQGDPEEAMCLRIIWSNSHRFTHDGKPFLLSAHRLQKRAEIRERCGRTRIQQSCLSKLVFRLLEALEALKHDAQCDPAFKEIRLKFYSLPREWQGLGVSTSFVDHGCE